ncbi:MAG: fimbrial protein [Deltaproteobacteria bacterium HGW-Deltaproteobacteria-4]|nr:MAG: fimbrial protein [Deltaproteobacteria bacterium HGW-Deltaproteobacteria-4]
MIKINLLPVRESQKKERLREQVVVLLACAIFTVSGCAAAYTTILAKISQKTDVISEQTKVIEQLKKQIGEVEKVKKLQAELQSKLDILGKLKANKTGPAHMLDELSMAIPEKLWIDSFDNIAGAVNLSGMGINEEIVAIFLQQLEASPYYMRVELQSLEQATIEGNKFQRFKVVAKEEVPPIKNVDNDKAAVKKSEPAQKT